MTSQENSESLWLKLLQQNSSRVIAPESSIVVVGDNGSGKTSFIDALTVSSASSSSTSSNKIGPMELLANNYFEIEDSGSVEANGVKVNVWGAGSRLGPLLFEAVQVPPLPHKLHIIILLDLTKDEATILQSMRQWIAHVHRFIKSYNAANDDKQWQWRYLEYLCMARQWKGQRVEKYSRHSGEEVATEGEAVNELHLHASADNLKFHELASQQFGVPLTVVGWKLDAALTQQANSTSSFAAMKALKEVQGKLRLLCLELGASLVFASSHSEHTHTVHRLKRYVLHRLYPEHIAYSVDAYGEGTGEEKQDGLRLEERLEGTFIPAGFDTLELINISTSEKPGNIAKVWGGVSSVRLLVEDIQANPSHYAVPTGNSAATPQTATQSFVELEGEQEWLATIQSTLTQAAESGVDSSAVSGTTSMAQSRPLSANSSSGDIAGLETVHKDAAVSSLLESGIAAEDAKTTNAAPKKVVPLSRKGSNAANAAPLSGKAANATDFFASLLKK